MIRDSKLDDEEILESLKKDAIGRNQQLVTFLGLINSIRQNSILTVDGEWGSGKTTFVKQIDFLNRNGSSDVSALNDDSINEFMNGYIVYYYSAWENDYHGEPLQSLLLNLINDLWSKREKIADGVVKYSEAFKQSVLETVTLGLYDTEKINNANNISDLAESIATIDERKEAIDDIINNHLDLKGKKLLFIIDELDRCMPTFAVRMLETIKHYYTNDRLVFLLATNSHELSHTVQKVYGESFDGIGYLNRFYDLVFNLPTVDRNAYIRHLGTNPSSNLWDIEILIEVVDYLDLSMREINRYYSSLGLIRDFGTRINRSPSNTSEQLVRYIFIPLAYGLRIHNIKDYSLFVQGRGASMLKEFCELSDLAGRIVSNNATDNSNDNPNDEVVKVYEKLFNTDLRMDNNRESYYISQSAEIFKQLTLLMNSSGMIDNAPQTTENPDASR